MKMPGFARYATVPKGERAKVGQKFFPASLAKKEKARKCRAFEVAGAGFEPATSGL
jgi:hypothetical protein